MVIEPVHLRRDFLLAPSPCFLQSCTILDFSHLALLLLLPCLALTLVSIYPVTLYPSSQASFFRPESRKGRQRQKTISNPGSYQDPGKNIKPTRNKGALHSDGNRTCTVLVAGRLDQGLDEGPLESEEEEKEKKISRPEQLLEAKGKHNRQRRSYPTTWIGPGLTSRPTMMGPRLLSTRAA